MENIPPIIKKISDTNINKKINIRTKKGQKQTRWSLFLDHFSNGKHCFIFPKKYILGTPQSKTEDNETLRWMQKYRDELERRMDLGEDVFSKDKPVVVYNFLDLIVHTENGMEALPMYRGLKKHIIDFGGNQICFQDITPLFCRKFKDYLLGRIKASTVKTYFSCLKATINRAIKEDIISDNPCKNISIKAQEAKKEFLLQDEIEKVVNQDTPFIEVKNAFLFSCFTGTRISDILALTWKEVEHGYLYFRQKKTKGNERMLLTADAISILDNQKQRHGDSNYVFDLPANNNEINAKLRSIIKSAGITKRISFHCGRHTAATSWITAGVDIFVVQKLLGHSDINTTMVYAKLIDKKRDEYVVKMPAIIKEKI
jgi:integrase